MIVTASAASPALTVAPVELPAEVKATVNASAPSTSKSSTAVTVNTIGSRLSPSLMAVNVSTPVSLSKLTPAIADVTVSNAAMVLDDASPTVTDATSPAPNCAAFPLPSSSVIVNWTAVSSVSVIVVSV